MDIPEIRTIVASFLDRSDLAAAALVCKSWNATFAPSMYSMFEWPNQFKKPVKEGIITHSRFVKEICLDPGTKISEIEYLYADNHLQFPALRKLYIDVKSALPFENQLWIIHKCPRLRELNWFIDELDPNKISDICDLFTTYCPLINCLCLAGCSPSDRDLSRILDSCCRLKNLTIIPNRLWEVGELGFQSLTRHFEHIRNLNLLRSLIPSKTTRTILTLCPNLSIFRGGTLDVRDIPGVVEEDGTGDKATGSQHREEWVCANLQCLDVFICGLEDKPLEWHRRFFQQLAKMEKLLGLSIGPLLNVNGESRDGVDVRLEAGLGLLSSLKEFHSLSVVGLWQQMEEKDVRWMIKAWPNLLSVRGTLHHNQERDALLKGILKEKGINGSQ